MLDHLNTIAKDYEYLIKAIAAFLPFLIALFMGYIAYQQWQTNERKRKQDLFEKRWAFYLKIKKDYELKIAGELDISDHTEYFVFSNIADEASCLFGMDIAEHIIDINENIVLGHYNYDWLSKPFDKYLMIEDKEIKTIWFRLKELFIFLYNFFVPVYCKEKIKKWVIDLKGKTNDGFVKSILEDTDGKNS